MLTSAILDPNASRKGAGRRSVPPAVLAQDCAALPADAQEAIRTAQSQPDPTMLEKIADAAEGQLLSAERWK